MIIAAPGEPSSARRTIEEARRGRFCKRRARDVAGVRPSAATMAVALSRGRAWPGGLERCGDGSTGRVAR
ncbi:Hypothetical protein A7982_10723 [Minicystis rosea]|nr:Hypothetical protein A7982_10723 [Minicystis rosea]